MTETNATYHDAIEELTEEFDINVESDAQLEINGYSHEANGTDITTTELTVYKPMRRHIHEVKNVTKTYITPEQEYRFEIRHRPVCPCCDFLLGVDDRETAVRSECEVCDTHTCMNCERKCNGCGTIMCHKHALGHGVHGGPLCAHCLDDVYRREQRQHAIEEWEMRLEQWKEQQEMMLQYQQWASEEERLRMELKLQFKTDLLRLQQEERQHIREQEMEKIKQQIDLAKHADEMELARSKEQREREAMRLQDERQHRKLDLEEDQFYHQEAMDWKDQNRKDEQFELEKEESEWERDHKEEELELERENKEHSWEMDDREHRHKVAQNKREHRETVRENEREHERETRKIGLDEDELEHDKEMDRKEHGRKQQEQNRKDRKQQVSAADSKHDRKMKEREQRRKDYEALTKAFSKDEDATSLRDLVEKLNKKSEDETHDVRVTNQMKKVPIEDL
jgi:hypothetical protein